MENTRLLSFFNNKVYSSTKTTEMSSHTNPGFALDEKYDKMSSSATNKNKTKIYPKDVFTIDLKDPTNKDREDYTNFDPYMHRNVEHPTTSFETLIHLLKGCLGTGILAMPKAFSNAGYLLGTLGTLLIGIICMYCIHLLLRSQYELCKRKRVGSLTYTATAEAAFADGPSFFKKLSPYSVHIVNTFLLVYQLGICCVYIVFIAANVQNVAKMYMKDLGIEIYMLIFLLPLIFINWIKDLKTLAPFSTAANIITLVSFGILLYYIIDEGPTVQDREIVGKIENIPLFFGTVLFALEAIGVIMPLENEIKSPKSFGKPCGVLNIGMSTIIFLYMGMGLLGYLSFGDTVEGSITLSIDETKILAQVMKISLALAIFVTYGLQCYVAVDITWNEYLAPKFEKNSRKVIWEYAVRTVIVLMTFLLAVAIPALDLFISLFGALCLSALGIAIPAAIETSTFWYSFDGCSFYFMFIKNLALIIFAICGLVAGTYTSMREIIHEFS